MTELGDNLTSYPNLTVLSAKDAEGIFLQLRQLRLPYKVIQMYSDGKKHYCFLSSVKKININKIRRKADGSIRSEN